MIQHEKPRVAEASLEFFATCLPGAEALLADELRALGVRRVRPLKGGVTFFGAPLDAERVCLWSRLAGRVTLTVARVNAGDADLLYAGAYAVPWEDVLAPGASLAVRARGTNAELRNSHFTELKLKDAVCDRVLARRSERPEVAPKGADAVIEARVREGRATLSLDLSGESLHRRAYLDARDGDDAPAACALAAALLAAAGWGSVAMAGWGLFDAACDDGLTICEAAGIAADQAPGLVRERWGFCGWALHDEGAWADLLAEADERFERGLAALAGDTATAAGVAGLAEGAAGSAATGAAPDLARVRIVGVSASSPAVARARGHVRAAGLRRVASVEAASPEDTPAIEARLAEVLAGISEKMAKNTTVYAAEVARSAETVAKMARIAVSEREACVNRGENGQKSERNSPAASPEACASPVAPDRAAAVATGEPSSAAVAPESPESASAAASGAADVPAPAAAGVPAPAPALLVAHAASLDRDPSDARAIAETAAFMAACAAAPAGSRFAWAGPEGVAGRFGIAPAFQAAISRGRAEACLEAFDQPPAARAVITVPDPQGGADHAVEVHDEAAAQFAARLFKVARERRKWARREGVACYRLYDADLPEYAAAIDLYQGAGDSEGKVFAHVAEYQAPRSVDPATARRRFEDVLAIVPVALGVRPDHVFSKVRTRSKGGSQYRDAGRRSYVAHTAEAGLAFEVDLAGYLDTGIFLDHRDTRKMVGRMARGKRFLNLFAYTGTASVHAAAGGAVETTTVDLSQTYLDWARRNLEANGFSCDGAGAGGACDSRGPREARSSRGPRGAGASRDARAAHPAVHHLERADVMDWIRDARRARRSFDLVFVDPPTFSNSKAMGKRTWDVQRDHVELLVGVSRLLAKDGVAVFSCNLRGFKPNVDELARLGVAIEDITERTIPHDFERNPKIHRCYLVRRN